MIHFFGNPQDTVYAVQTQQDLTKKAISKLVWLFGNSPQLEASIIDAFFIGPRAAMITPWSTNAVEITQNMGIGGILRIEEFAFAKAKSKSRQDISTNPFPSIDDSSIHLTTAIPDFDPMISQLYTKLDQEIFTIHVVPEEILPINNIASYNEKEGLSLSDEEVIYLNQVSEKIGRPLTDSEVFGFSQVNSEHCRHKIFNGTFVIDGEEMPSSLFKLIKETSKAHPGGIVSAYKDNVAFIEGPMATQFAPDTPDKPDFYKEKEFESVISLKAETHNFPTTVEPFNGAATGSGGEIRDRLAGGKGSLPLAGTAVYMTPFSRLEANRSWENNMTERKWLYQNPIDILIKASNGASDFGNKFGQPLIAGSVLTFEHEEDGRRLGYDKVIMQAGGIGYGKREQALKDTPTEGDKIVIIGGENYRIGMGGAAVSSADTGALDSGIELNAVQRSNPEMQKRAANAVRGMVESDFNPIVSIHDHGAGGHLNCLSELVEDTGGLIDLDKLPVGDPTLSAKEIIGNESQERMGLVIGKENLNILKRIADRERAPMYTVGDVTNNDRFTFQSSSTGKSPMDLQLEDMFGSSPKTVMTDKTIERSYASPKYELGNFHDYLEQVLQLEAVACKDWLTNKVDRCVGGRVAKQQCAGPLQLPLNNVGVMALDFKSTEGVATSIGHSPISGLIDPIAGSKNSIAEALTNIVWAPLTKGLSSVSLSANWMWPCKNEGEDARLYKAVKAISEMAINLGINVPTGKDSLSMKQKYPDGDVIAPGTVVISAAGSCNDINQVVEPVLQKDRGHIYYINMSGDSYKLGGSSFAQVCKTIGHEAPTIVDDAAFAKAFNTLQTLIKDGKICAGHDVASGGLITTLLELCFADKDLGADFDLTPLGEQDLIKLLFSENAGVVFQAVDDSIEEVLVANNILFSKIGSVTTKAELTIKNNSVELGLNISSLRDTWFKTSYLLDEYQTANGLAKERFDNYKTQPLQYNFPLNFSGTLPTIDISKKRPKAAILREKGSNSEREMANAMYLAGFDVKDVHMTDLIEGRETLEDIQFLGAVGGFSNSDVLGSAKGWAGAIKYNEKANKAIKNFFAREDTLSVGICNGCQLFLELDLINPEHEKLAKMTYNLSQKHESNFTSVVIQKNNSVMLSSLEGTTLGVWISHGEGKFNLPMTQENYDIVATYAYDSYPSNPNGSDYNTAMICDTTGRHLATMPHIERSTFPWNWAHYPKGQNHKVSPWIEAFVNARIWVENNSII
ncbi:phosphoribosylformylglycinamidine synthase [Dokdonia sp. Hel_I_53]|uniref:phosphoribosylformylglycinamidine synthase n=1 Tax=Dokdonia sp. Hel_I_53 TaxID=1566287 RepID=UPI00119A2562|nr:phosphoribosylformylglycinamidine synthase [Dokdonia sp. Hel_I_53]TVZ51447.1 phosphoribosylformylglycinamidine synthase [Dokdonia sp. Hel_I_53]